MTAAGHEGVGLVVPDDWTLEVGTAAGVPLVALAPPSGQFRANATVTVGAVPAGLGFRDWQAGADALLPRALEQYQLLDLEHATVDGRPAVRRIAHHVADGTPVTMEQWAVLADGRGVTLTVTVTTPEWAVLAEAAGAIGRSLTVAGPVGRPA